MPALKRTNTKSALENAKLLAEMREYRSTLLGNPDEDRKDGLIIIKPVLDGRLKNVNTAPKPDVKKETTDTSLLE